MGPDEFQKLLETRDGMSPEIALDFTEQLLMFEKFGNVYDTPELVQAKQVRAILVDGCMDEKLIATMQIPGLTLQTWDEFLEENDLLAYMKRS